MKDFFNGWRRKAGCVVLVLAIVLWCVWVRSLTGLDVTVFNNATMALASTPNTMGLITVNEGETVGISYFYENPQFYENTEWSWRCYGFGVGQLKRAVLMAHIAADGTIVRHDIPPAIFANLYMIPYWSVVLPLTFASGYLLLIPSRKRGEAGSRDMPNVGQ